MVRWRPGTRERLQAAALELFAERGFDETTVAEIAARTGVAERTFFRYYADKREVLFEGQDALTDAFVTGVAAAPPAASALEAVQSGLDAAAALFPDERRAYAQQRQDTIDATPSLREREMLKLAALTRVLAAALRDRAVPDSQATLAAETAITVLRVGLERWRLDPRGRSLRELQRDTLAELRALAR